MVLNLLPDPPVDPNVTGEGIVLVIVNEAKYYGQLRFFHDHPGKKYGRFRFSTLVAIVADCTPRLANQFGYRFTFDACLEAVRLLDQHIKDMED